MSQLTNWVQRLSGRRNAGPEVQYRSSSENVYHCCVHKTASQWIARILGDEETFRFSGLTAHRYQRELPGGADTRPIRERVFDQPFPPRTIVTPIYIGLENFLSIPKPASYRAFFVMRDPRDVLVSWYFSWKHSHPVMGDIAKQREQLQVVSETEGLAYGVQSLHAEGLFDALRSWHEDAGRHPELMLVRYEDLIDQEQFSVFKRQFAHCDIRLPDDRLRALLEKNSFAALTEGRPRGTEDVKSHLRKGIHGDWKNHFTPEVEKSFRSVANDLVETLGYSW